MDDTYHTLEALSLKASLHVISRSGTTWPIETNGATPQTNGLAAPTNGDAIHINGAATQNELAVWMNGYTKESAMEVSLPEVDGPPRDSITPVESSRTDHKHQLLVYSARDEAALKRVLQQYSKYYDDCIQGSPGKLQKLAYTLAARRSMMTMRSFTVGDANLSSEAIGLPNSDIIRSSLETQLCFVFTGQGAQYAKMGLELIQYPVFMSVLTKANKVFQAIGADWSLFGM